MAATKYDPSVIESKWQKIWEENQIYNSDDFSPKPKKYILVEFPYPSGDRLHVGHGRSYTAFDAVSRFYRLKGFNVLYPLGWDAFGLPAENYAIKTGINPAITTAQNIAHARVQAKSWGLSFDWSREISTTDSKYYQWTQWIFLQLFKNGLAYKSETAVNFCPFCKTNLANEEVEADGTHERCGQKTEKRMQKQWILAITRYAERLLKDLDLTEYWPKIKEQQKNWIGKSEGVTIKFQISSTKSQISTNDQIQEIEVFTKFPETIFGVTYLVVAPEHPFVTSLLSSKSQGSDPKLLEVERYVEQAKTKVELERLAENKEKTGVPTGLSAIDPVNGQEIPIWVADYALASVGTGAVMGVPAHDERDYQFAKKYDLPIELVIQPPNASDVGAQRAAPSGGARPAPTGESYEGPGVLINSEQFNGLDREKGKNQIIAWLQEKGWGQTTTTYHLHDWVFSRQHYWGEPIPMIFCSNCAAQRKSWFQTDEYVQWSKNQKLKIKNQNLNLNLKSDLDSLSNLAGWFPIPEKDLPLELPYVEKYQPMETGESPLAAISDWVNTTCPNCGGPAKRETDTMPNWAGSNWYYLAYLVAGKLGDQKSNYSPEPKPREIKDQKFTDIFTENKKLLDYWMPVDWYNGGWEHVTLHVLYSRFIYKFLFDLGVVPGPEPYLKRTCHGVILGPDGSKMSKSKGNVINPDEVIKEYGADTFRMYEMFIGPFGEVATWNSRGLVGVKRFLNKVWELFENDFIVGASRGSTLDVNAGGARPAPTSTNWDLNYLIKKVEEDIPSLSFNTAIAAMMEYVNKIKDQRSKIKDGGVGEGRYLSKDQWEVLLKVLAPFAPHLSEELWQRLKGRVAGDQGQKFISIHQQTWPMVDQNLWPKQEYTIIIQINGKVRSSLLGVSAEEIESEERIVAKAKSQERLQKYLAGQIIKKTIYVKGKVLNFVV